jgi:hypothetical protein
MSVFLHGFTVSVLLLQKSFIFSNYKAVFSVIFAAFEDSRIKSQEQRLS